MALCPVNQMKTAEKAYNRCLTWMSASGKGACADAIGLFGNMEPFKARHERLSYGYHRRIHGHGITDSFAIHYAMRAVVSMKCEQGFLIYEERCPIYTLINGFQIGYIRTSRCGITSPAAQPIH